MTPTLSDYPICKLIEDSNVSATSLHELIGDNNFVIDFWLPIAFSVFNIYISYIYVVTRVVVILSGLRNVPDAQLLWINLAWRRKRWATRSVC